MLRWRFDALRRFRDPGGLRWPPDPAFPSQTATEHEGERRPPSHLGDRLMSTTSRRNRLASSRPRSRGGPMPAPAAPAAGPRLDRPAATALTATPAPAAPFGGRGGRGSRGGRGGIPTRGRTSGGLRLPRSSDSTPPSRRRREACTRLVAITAASNTTFVCPALGPLASSFTAALALATLAGRPGEPIAVVAHPDRGARCATTGVDG